MRNLFGAVRVILFDLAMQPWMDWLYSHAFLTTAQKGTLDVHTY